MPDDRCYHTALRILNVRFNSEAELRRKLGRKFGEDEVEAVIERLRGEKWLDDERFAGAFTRARANRRMGRKRILRELQAAGVKSETARQAVTENLDPDREREAVRALCLKKARLLDKRHGEGYTGTEEGRNKLAVYLLNQGYDAALVYEALKEIRGAHHQPDS